MYLQSVMYQTQMQLRVADDLIGHNGPTQDHIVLFKTLCISIQGMALCT